jgi:hypothetical protein
MRAWQVPALAQAQCEGHHRIKLSHNPEQWCSFSNAKGIMLLMPDAQFSQSTTTGGGGGQMLVPATGSTQWTYLDGTGAEHGPFAVAQLQEWYRAGQLTMDRKLRPAGGAGGFLPLSSIAELVSQLQSGQQPTQQLGQPTMQVVHAQAPAVHAAVTTAAHAPAPEPQPTVPEGVPPTFNKEVVQQTF